MAAAAWEACGEFAGRGPAGATWPSACWCRSAATTRRWPSSASCWHHRPVRRRTLVDDAGRRLRAVQRQPAGQRRGTLPARHRHRLPARQPAPDRRGGVGPGARASRRGDLAGTLRWIGSAENTALAEADDLLGVPFLCDMAMVLGGARRARPGDDVPRPGRPSAARCSPTRSPRRRSCSTPARAISATSTHGWRTRARSSGGGCKLVAALAVARQGDLERPAGCATSRAAS